MNKRIDVDIEFADWGKPRAKMHQMKKNMKTSNIVTTGSILTTGLFLKNRMKIRSALASSLFALFCAQPIWAQEVVDLRLDDPIETAQGAIESVVEDATSALPPVELPEVELVEIETPKDEIQDQEEDENKAEFSGDEEDAELEAETSEEADTEPEAEIGAPDIVNPIVDTEAAEADAAIEEAENPDKTAEVPIARDAAIDDIAENIKAAEKADSADNIPNINAGEASQLQSSIRAHLGGSIKGASSAEIEALRAFYSARSYKPYLLSNKSANKAVDFAVSNAPKQGLPASRYPIPSSSSDPALIELQMAANFIRYARDMEVGIVRPRDMGEEFDFAPQGRDRLSLYKNFANAKDKMAYVNALEPNDPAYPVLKKELARMRTFMRDDIANPVQVPAGKSMRLGDQNARVGKLRARLNQLGFHSGATGNSNLFDAGLDGALKKFQSSAGLSADGVAGPATLSYLNSGPKDRLRAVLVGMERHRWGPQNRSGRRLYVNIANFKAEIRDNNKKVFETIVVVGKNEDALRTPEFNDKMTHIIVNPKWNVPQSISVKEYLPKIQRDPSLLERNNITMRIKGSGQVVSPRQIDMSQFTVDDFPFLLQQQSGDGNALGVVKFMFPNRHNIYLHDTPSKSLFKRGIRTFSHGCVRVGDPEDLATVLLSKQMKNPRDTYRGYVSNGKERQVNLATPVPIYLTYHTAYLNNSGTISYMPDSYGRDRRLARLLAGKGLEI